MNIIKNHKELEIYFDKIRLPEFANLYRADGAVSFPVREANGISNVFKRMIFLYSTFKHSFEIELPIEEKELRNKVSFHLRQFANELTKLSVELHETVGEL